MMAKLDGRTFGKYRIVELIGAGGMGEVYRQQGNFEFMARAQARAVRLAPDNFDANYGLGFARQMLGRIESAIESSTGVRIRRGDALDAELQGAWKTPEYERFLKSASVQEEAEPEFDQPGPLTASAVALIGVVILIMSWKTLERADRPPERDPQDVGFGMMFLVIIAPAFVFGYLVPLAVLPALSDDVWMGVFPRLAAHHRNVTLILAAAALVLALGVPRVRGADLVLTDGAKGMKGAIEKAQEMAASDPERYFMPQQFENPANPAIHERTTGPEIWEQTEDKVTHIIAGVSTGGTISGTSKYLKQHNPNLQVWGIDTYGSVFKKYH